MVRNTDLKNVITKLLKWHKDNRINYPWRKDRRIFIRALTELFLKRTTAEAVQRNWNILINLSDPRNVIHMSISDLKENLKVFGLVNSRSYEVIELAKSHLHKSLNKQTIDELLNIKGIGHYTANAIQCFIGNKRTIILDSNYARLFSKINNKVYTPLDKNLQELLDRIISTIPSKCKMTNEAILDFTKIICRPSYPKCNICPIKNECLYTKKNIN